MLKIITLRSAIEQAIPELVATPNLLRIWVDRGSGQSRQTPNLSLAFKFRLNVLLLDFTADIAVLALAIFRWARVHQPDLLAVGADGFNFEVDFLDENKADLLFQLDLGQSIAVYPTDTGYTVTYLPEPDPLFADDAAPNPLTTIPTLTNVVVEGTALPDS